MEALNAERLSWLAEVMPTIQSSVQVGDRIKMGIRNDPLFPEEFNVNRPEGTVTKVKHVSQKYGGGTSIKVQFPGGKEHVVSAHNCSPDAVWEPADPSVLSKMGLDTTYRGGGGADVPDISEMVNELRSLQDDFDSNVKSFFEYRGNILEALAKVSQEVSDAKMTASEDTFSSTYSSTYKSTVAEDPSVLQEPPNTYRSSAAITTIDELRSEITSMRAHIDNVQEMTQQVQKDFVSALGHLAAEVSLSVPEDSFSATFVSEYRSAFGEDSLPVLQPASSQVQQGEQDYTFASDMEDDF